MSGVEILLDRVFWMRRNVRYFVIAGLPSYSSAKLDSYSRRAKEKENK